MLEKLNEFTLYHDNESFGLHNDYRYKYALPFEKIDDPVGGTVWFQKKMWHHSITISIIYIAVIKSIQWFMKDRKPFQLRWPLIIWNTFLAIFATTGLIRFTEDLIHSLYHKGLYPSVCYSVHPNGVAAFWAVLFGLSKAVDLGDTVFIVLRKRPLIFLHYYHHATSLIYTWHSGGEHTGSGRPFIAMNYLAHSFMYTYYAFTAYGIRPPRKVAMGVTTIQISQMIVGCFITFYVYWILTRTNLPCQQSMGNLYLAFLIYITYAVLFIHFFIKAYFLRPKKLKKID